MTVSKENFPFVDVLRGFAAIMVLVFHAMYVGGRSEFPEDEEIWQFFDFGWVGVNLFLVISGFVITLSLFRHIQRAPGSFARAFAVSRLARILPLYLLTGVVFLAVADPAWLRGALAERLTHIGTHLVFIHNLLPETHGSIDGPNWSIALEMQFYLCMLLLAPWLTRRAGWVHLVAALLIATLFRYLAARMVPQGESVLQFVYATQLPGMIGHFALGAAVAFAVSPMRRSAVGAVGAMATGWRQFLGWLTLSVLLLALSAFLVTKFGYWDNDWMVTFLPTALSVGFMALLSAAITFPLSNMPAFLPFRYLGDISYGLYLWHMPVLVYLEPRAPALQGAEFLAVVLGVTFVLSVLSWHLLERPLSRFFRERMAPSSMKSGSDAGYLTSQQAP